jgi:hypothetical protein
MLEQGRNQMLEPVSQMLELVSQMLELVSQMLELVSQMLSCRPLLNRQIRYHC